VATVTWRHVEALRASAAKNEGQIAGAPAVLALFGALFGFVPRVWRLWNGYCGHV
jgi:hypothetical protein